MFIITHLILFAIFILAAVVAVDEIIIVTCSAFYFSSVVTSSTFNTKINNASSTLIVISEIKRADCPSLQYCPEPGDISYSVTASDDTTPLGEFMGKSNGSRLTIQPGEFRIDVLPAVSIGLGWEYVNSTFSGDSCIRGPDKENKGDASVHGIGFIGTGETQRCVIQNYYETDPGYKNEEKIEEEKLKN